MNMAQILQREAAVLHYKVSKNVPENSSILGAPSSVERFLFLLRVRRMWAS